MIEVSVISVLFFDYAVYVLFGYAIYVLHKVARGDGPIRLTMVVLAIVAIIIGLALQ